MAGEATFTTYGPNSAQQGLEEAEAFNAKGALKDQSAYGSVPNAPSISPTVGAATGAAIDAGQQAASQLPGYAADVGQVGANISADLAGQLSPDVIQQLQQAAAERGVATGTAGSPNNSAAYLRALGLTSLNEEQTGQQDLQSFVQSLPGYGVSPNPNFEVTPQGQYQADLQSAIYAAAPQPGAAAAAGLAATGAGFSAGAGSIRPGLGAATTVAPASPFPAAPPQAQPAMQPQGIDPTTEILNKYALPPAYSMPGWQGGGTISEPGFGDTVGAFPDEVAA